MQPLLEDRIPIQPGSTGTLEYITQPVQQLSWYPRYVLVVSTRGKGETSRNCDGMSTSLLQKAFLFTHRMYVWPKFISQEQCEQLIEVAAARLTPSALALRSGETEEGTRYMVFFFFVCVCCVLVCICVVMCC